MVREELFMPVIANYDQALRLPLAFYIYNRKIEHQTILFTYTWREVQAESLRIPWGGTMFMTYNGPFITPVSVPSWLCRNYRNRHKPMNVRYEGQSLCKENMVNRNQNTFIRAGTRVSGFIGCDRVPSWMSVRLRYVFGHILRHSTMLMDLDKYSGGEGQCNLNLG
jgi:hypothetical protein